MDFLNNNIPDRFLFSEVENIFPTQTDYNFWFGECFVLVVKRHESYVLFRTCRVTISSRRLYGYGIHAKKINENNRGKYYLEFINKINWDDVDFAIHIPEAKFYELKEWIISDEKRIVNIAKLVELPDAVPSSSIFNVNEGVLIKLAKPITGKISVNRTTDENPNVSWDPYSPKTIAMYCDIVEVDQFYEETSLRHVCCYDNFEWKKIGRLWGDGWIRIQREYYEALGKDIQRHKRIVYGKLFSISLHGL